MSSLLIALVSGCGATISGDTYCDLSRSIMFNDEGVIEDLLASDPALLRQIVQHNETREAICAG